MTGIITDHRLVKLSAGVEPTAVERRMLRTELESYLSPDLPEDRDGSQMRRHDAALASAVLHYRRLMRGQLL